MKILLKRILLTFAVILIILAAVGVYSYYIEPSQLIVHEENLKIPHWNAKLDGFKVVAISDIHGGSHYITEEKIREIVRLANEQNPDLIVLLGDYVSQKTGIHSELKMPSETIAANLKGLQAKYGVYAIIGNHDWWFDEKKMRVELEGAGIKVLDNEVVPVQVSDEMINLWGIEDNWKNRQVPIEAFNRIPVKENIIAITHNPDSLLKAPAEISLMLAGHTHGGQVKFPVYGAIAFVNDKRFMAGEVVVDGKHVFVTTGIGTTGPPIRFRVPPEIAVLRLFAEN
ncbi:MAG: metallophosphoesterase [Acidobacteriota bacterium]|nr:metallophosphoesterase [Acidobacteriota bacterium]